MTAKRKRTTLKADIFDQLIADDVKKDIDIVRLFHDFGVTLTKKGNSYTGLCPFHDDKTPSLSVDQAKGLFNCFGCGESGDVITLVAKTKGFSFKESMEYLKTWKSGVSANLTLHISDADNSQDSEAIEPQQETDDSIPPPNSQTVTEAEPTPVSISLTDVTDHYNKKFYESGKATEYLQSRGLTNPELYNRFKIGFANGSLLSMVSENQKIELKDLGIINDYGYETFNNCLVFPILDDHDTTVGLYGRNIDEKAKVQHLYLKGKHKGVFNRKASGVYDTIILAESIIDALSLMQLGFNNVQALYGTNGFTKEHLRTLKEDRVNEIIIALDNDPAGTKATGELQQKLAAEGFRVKVIVPPAGKDWNEVLLSGITADEITALIDQATAFKKEEKKQEFGHSEEKGVHFFTFGKLHYRLTGVKELFVTNLKVNIRAEMGELYFPDAVDLCTYRSRLGYSNHLAGKFGVEPELVENHLLKMLRFLEKRREEKLNPEVEKRAILTETEKQEALAFLSSPNLTQQTVEDITSLGYTGEDSNKLLTYVIGLSRYMPKPLSLYVLSSAGTGKSYLVDTVTLLFPCEAVKHTSSMSEQAYHYMPDENFDGKIYVMGEDLHSLIIEGQIRQMQTEGRLTRDVVQKDEKTGEMRTVTITHKVRLVFMSTSTKLDVNIENLSRCILLKVDESAEQTGRVLESQRENDDFFAQLEKKHLVPGIIKKHTASQSLLQPIRIYNPYAIYIRFPTHKALFRRSQPYFLLLIKTICYWRQYQKKPVLKENPYTGGKEQWYACDLTDYELARTLFLQSNLLSYVEELPEPLIDLYESIREMVRKKAEENNLSVTETGFIQREIREITGLKNTSIKMYLQKLVEYEYIQLIGGKRHGTRFSYKLREDSPIDQVNTASIIPTVEQIKAMMKKNKS